MSSEMFRGASGPRVGPVPWRVVNRGGVSVLDQLSVAQQLEQKFLEGRQKGAGRSAVDGAPGSGSASTGRPAASSAIYRSSGGSASKAAGGNRADLVRLSTAIASRILHREITLDPDSVHGLLRAAFDKVQAREITRIFVHPAHQEAVRRFVEQSAIRARLKS